MLDLYFPMQTLTTSTAADWRCTTHPHIHAEGDQQWTHAHGLRIHVKAHRSQWDLVVEPPSLDDTLLSLRMPRSQPGLDITDLKADLDAWIQALDIGPSRKMAETLGAWLIMRDTVYSYVVELKHASTLSITVRPGDGPAAGHPAHLCVPPRLIEMMQPDLQDFWSKMPTPTWDRNRMLWTPGQAAPKLPRTLEIHIPEMTGHARLERISQLPSELRIPQAS